MPRTFNCSPPGQVGVALSDLLIEYGGLVPLTVRSNSGAERKLRALIDTGSQYTVIDEGMAKQLQLVPLRQEQIGTVNQLAKGFALDIPLERSEPPDRPDTSME